MEAAYRFGVTGFVKNKKDGSVYIEAEGPEENIQSFVEWCHKGPTWARITKVDIEQGDIQNFKSFEIVR